MILRLNERIFIYDAALIVCGAIRSEDDNVNPCGSNISIRNVGNFNIKGLKSRELPLLLSALLSFTNSCSLLSDIQLSCRIITIETALAASIEYAVAVRRCPSRRCLCRRRRRRWPQTKISRTCIERYHRWIFTFRLSAAGKLAPLFKQTLLPLLT